MTHNQIAWFNAIESARSNRARESETHRSNLFYEGETKRSNLARETETNRSNLAKEFETNRHNRESEGISLLDFNERARHNRVSENNDALRTREISRANRAQEYLNRQNLLLTDQRERARQREVELQNQRVNALRQQEISNYRDNSLLQGRLRVAEMNLKNRISSRSYAVDKYNAYTRRRELNEKRRSNRARETLDALSGATKMASSVVSAATTLAGFIF